MANQSSCLHRGCTIDRYKNATRSEMQPHCRGGFFAGVFPCASLFIAFLVREPTPQTTRADRPAFCRFAPSVLSKGVQGSRYSATDNLAAFDTVRAMKSRHHDPDRSSPKQGATSQGSVSAIIVTHWYMARKNPAPATSTNSASLVWGIITPRRKKAPQRGDWSARSRPYRG